jgi:hypothetical protein
MFPVYLLARRFMSFGRAFTVALLSVVIGPMFYTFTIMAESLHYPLIMWAVYLIYLSLIREKRFIDIMLGLVFGLALLNKMSSLALFVCYNMLIGISFNETNIFRSIKCFPGNYLRGVIKYRHVFIVLAITVLPYLIYRAMAIENNSTVANNSIVPYTVEWVRFFSNILHFDVVKYLKWFLVYLGQLNLSTGLFLLPLSIFMIIFLCRSDRRENRIFGLSAAILMVVVLALAVLQSGYNLERLTERHFFILSPLIFILSFMWLQSEAKILPKAVRLTIAFAFVITTSFALFNHSKTCSPAIDSAFIDCLRIAIRQGANELLVKLVVLIVSILLTIFGCFTKSKRRYVISIVVAFVIMLSITIPCYSDAIRHLEYLREIRSPVTSWISKSVSRPANLVFLGLEHVYDLDYIIWNKDSYSRVLWDPPRGIENPAGFRYHHKNELLRAIDRTNSTYFICPFFSYSSADLVAHKDGLYIYKINDVERVSVNGFHISFGAPYIRQVLKEGWGGDEGGFVWAVGRRSDIDIYIESVESEKTLIFKARPYPPHQSVKVIVNGEDIGTIVMQPGWHEYRLQIDATHLKLGKNSVAFKFRHAKSPSESGGRDTRKLAAAFDWLKLEDAATLEWSKTTE